jgi:hypothetical protein
LNTEEIFEGVHWILKTGARWRICETDILASQLAD